MVNDSLAWLSQMCVSKTPAKNSQIEVARTHGATRISGESSLEV
jgi:hypothetical protein